MSPADDKRGFSGGVGVSGDWRLPRWSTVDDCLAIDQSVLPVDDLAQIDRHSRYTDVLIESIQELGSNNHFLADGDGFRDWSGSSATCQVDGRKVSLTEAASGREENASTAKLPKSPAVPRNSAR